MRLSASAPLLLLALAATTTTMTTTTAFLLPTPASSTSSTSALQAASEGVQSSSSSSSSSPSLAGGLWRSLGLLTTAAAATLIPGPMLSEAAAAAGGGAKGLGTLNEFLTSVREVKQELQGDGATDLRKVQRALDVEAVTTSVDAALDAQFGKLDQTAIIAKRKVVDKVLRQVLNDVISVEDALRDFPERTGASRMKKVSKPLGKLEGDLGRLTSALTSEGDSADAAGIQKPLFSLCADGYLLCEPQ